MLLWNFYLIFCADVNECQVRPGLCQNGRCINTPGSVTCQCQAGYTLSADGINCRGITWSILLVVIGEN